MGMYCEVYGREVKMGGLLATAVVEAASGLGKHAYEGVALIEVDGDFFLDGGVVALTRPEVEEVVRIMRYHLVEGQWVRRANAWAKYHGSSLPLSHLQDVMGYVSDVETFESLVLWLVHTNEQELVWA